MRQAAGNADSSKTLAVFDSGSAARTDDLDAPTHVTGIRQAKRAWPLERYPSDERRSETNSSYARTADCVVILTAHQHFKG